MYNKRGLLNMVSFIVVRGFLVCNFKNLDARFLPHVGQKKGNIFWRDKLFYVILYFKQNCSMYVVYCMYMYSRNHPVHQPSTAQACEIAT